MKQSCARAGARRTGALFFPFFDFAFRNPHPRLHVCALSVSAKADLGVVVDLQFARALMYQRRATLEMLWTRSNSRFKMVQRFFGNASTAFQSSSNDRCVVFTAALS